ncbi:MAG: hypothetical protein H5T74_06810 [Actinobacteria bacterium]|nr:hypothetical protein [Actinomycetota bacterium]
MTAASNIRVLKRRERAEDATDIALLVSTSSKEEINLWDKSKIVDSLILETDASPELARLIADRVEQRIVEGHMNTVTTSIIRELVDLELLERGLGTMHKRHSHLGLPMYDVEQIITSANKENSNTTHNPESINLTLAEAILKEFALRKVFSEDIARAHMVGDIHLHDLGFIIRPYSYLGDTVIHWRVKGSPLVFTTTMEQLYHLLGGETRPEPTVRVKYPSRLEILDRGGNWTEIRRVVKKDRLGKQMIFLATSDGKRIVVTHDHPVITTDDVKPASLVRPGDEVETIEVGEGRERGMEELDIAHLLEAGAVTLKFRFNAEDMVLAHQRMNELVAGAARASRPSGTARGTRPAVNRARVVMAEPVEVLDVYIYDVTTASGTLIADGIYSHNCGGHSLDYIKKYGISLPNITSTSRPAKHPEVLIGHMVKMASTLQSHYAGAIGWEAVNMFFAPYLVGLGYDRIKQLAQMLIYEFNQLAGARGSLRADEKIFVYDRLKQSVELVEIGPFVESFTGTEGEATAPVEGDRYYAVSFDHRTGKTRLARIYAAIRHENKHRIVEVTTGQGQAVKVTDNHSLFAFDERGEVVKALPRENPETVLTPAVIDIDSVPGTIDVLSLLADSGGVEEDGKVFIVARGRSRLGIDRRLAVTPELARLLGYYVAEGSLGSQVRLHLYERALEADAVACVERVFGISCTVSDGTCHFGGKAHVALFEALCGRGAENKRIPAAVLLGDEEVVREFLAAYLSGDGYVSRNRIGCSTVSDILKSHLWFAFTRLGATPSMRTDSLEPPTIGGAEIGKAARRHVLAIGRQHLDRVYFAHPRKESERLRLIASESGAHGLRSRSYRHLEPLIEETLGNRVWSEKIGRLTPKKIAELRDEVERRQAGVDIRLLEQLYGQDLTELCRRYVEDAGLPHSTARGLLRELEGGSVPVHSCHLRPDAVLEGTEYGGVEMRGVFDSQYLPRALEEKEEEEGGGRFIEARQLDSNFNMLKGGLELALEQHRRLSELSLALERSENLLPASVRSIEEIEGQPYVYDIGVEETENFLTGDGIFAHNSQVVFTDFNLYWNVPRHFRDTPAIGPGGEYTGKTYKDYEKEAQTFLKALFEVYLEGDAMGKTFVFPKPLLHINEDFFRTEGHEEFLDLACKVASRQGITYFVFDRGDEITVSQCCRLKLRLKEQDLQETMTPERMRFSALQNITINLPRIAYKANGSDEVLFHELEKAMQMVAKAHLQKKEFISSLMALGIKGPLSVLCDDKDGEPYLRLDRLTYLAGLLGLNEMVQYHTGMELHQSQEALKFGLKVVAHMNLTCKRLSEEYGINMVLEESPAESSGYRLAKLDMKYYPAQAMQVLKGDIERDEFYYTNSVHLNVEADIDYIERVQKQSLFHPLIEAGAICHIWLGEHEPDPASIKNFVIKTFRNTHSSQIAFSPEFTVCNDCRRTHRGLHQACPHCGSEDVYGITRIVGYFSKITTWNKGKVGELKDRVRTSLKGGMEGAASEGVR